MSILIADDDAVIRAVLAGVLQHRGHTTSAAASVEEAMQLMEVNRFDAALIDARMPGNGAELRLQLERGSLNGRTILMTGDTTGIEGQPNPVLSKPFDYDELVRLLEGMIAN